MRFDYFIRPVALWLCLLSCLEASAQVRVGWSPQPQHDVGMVAEEDGVVERLFTARNTGADSWQVIRGFTSCGCTTVEVQAEQVVRPSDSTLVMVRFNPASKSGPFRETVTIQLSDGDRTFNQQLVLTGEVRPSQQSISRQFPYALGDLRISGQSIDFGEVKRGARVERHVAFCNVGATPCVLTLRASHASLAISEPSLTLDAGATRHVTLVWDGARDTEWGSAHAELSVASSSERYQALVRLSAVLLPDFSHLSAAQLSQAAQLKTERRIELPLPAAGQKCVQRLSIQNTGAETLRILSAYSSVDGVKVLSAFPLMVGPGKSAAVEVEIVPGSAKDIPITLISTDARKPRQTVRICLK